MSSVREMVSKPARLLNNGANTMDSYREGLVPPWFSLESYRVSRSMGLSAWVRALEVRDMLWNRESMVSVVPPYQPISDEGYLDCCMRVSTQVADFHDQPGFKYKVEYGEGNQSWSTVSPVTQDELQSVEQETPEFLYNLDNYHSDRPQALVAVDIDASEDRLIADFRKFLAESKSRLGLHQQKRSFSSLDFEKWSELKVLEYLDLLLWHRYCGTSFTHQEIGVCLYPDEFHISLDDRIRRTVRPRALNMISSAFLAAITSQERAQRDG